MILVTAVVVVHVDECTPGKGKRKTCEFSWKTDILWAPKVLSSDPLHGVNTLFDRILCSDGGDEGSSAFAATGSKNEPKLHLKQQKYPFLIRNPWIIIEHPLITHPGLPLLPGCDISVLFNSRYLIPTWRRQKTWKWSVYFWISQWSLDFRTEYEYNYASFLPIPYFEDHIQRLSLLPIAPN